MLLSQQTSVLKFYEQSVPPFVSTLCLTALEKHQPFQRCWWLWFEVPVVLYLPVLSPNCACLSVE